MSYIHIPLHSVFKVPRTSFLFGIFDICILSVGIHTHSAHEILICSNFREKILPDSLLFDTNTGFLNQTKSPQCAYFLIYTSFTIF